MYNKFNKAWKNFINFVIIGLGLLLACAFGLDGQAGGLAFGLLLTGVGVFMIFKDNRREAPSQPS